MVTSVTLHKNLKNRIEREEAKEYFKQEALGSWTAYQETGSHLTATEVSDWLNSWGADKETEIPKCHE